MIFTTENGQIVSTEQRERHTDHNAQGNNQEHEHFHGSSPEHDEKHDEKHDEMAAEIADCQVMIVGGMGYGAYQRFFMSGINIILNDKNDINEAVNLFLQNKLPNLVNERTH